MSQVDESGPKNHQEDSIVQNTDLLHYKIVRSSDNRQSTGQQQKQERPQCANYIHNFIGTISDQIIQVILPVTLCALYSCMVVRILSWNMTSGILGETWQGLDRAESVERNDDYWSTSAEQTTTSVSTNLLIVLIFCLLIISITLVILLIFYMEWHNCLVYYFYVPTLIILAIVTPAFAREALRSFNWFSVDIITALIFTWNYTIFGIVSIFGLVLQAPILCQKFYLIHNSAVLSVLIIHTLPGWAPWLLLVFLILWDLFAVLAPIGPLKLILNMAERSGVVDMPGIIYSTANSPPPTKAEVTCNISDAPQEHERRPRRDSRDAPEKGFSIGLGDFIFYSLLVALTAKDGDMDTFYAVLATLNAVLVGLIMTLAYLALKKQTLPALPTSIGLGLTVALATMYFVPSLSNRLAANSVFI